MPNTTQDLVAFESKLTEGKHKLAEKAAQDPAFHDALTANPKETIEKFFQLPEGTLKDVAVEIIQEKPQTIGIVLPPRPTEGSELSEEQLEAIAGGAVFIGMAIVGTVGTVVGAVAITKKYDIKPWGY